jgi:hypothetical protein
MDLGLGDTGPDGIEAFKEQHVCNKICTELGLKLLTEVYRPLYLTQIHISIISIHSFIRSLVHMISSVRCLSFAINHPIYHPYLSRRHHLISLTSDTSHSLHFFSHAALSV